MKAVILAGGFGTRMRPLTFSRPKPLMPILNRPITAHILDYLKEHGIKEVALATNYLRAQINDYFGDNYRGIKLTYPIEDKPLGTAGCVKNIDDFFDDTFLVMQGDTITDINLTHLIKQHKYYSGLATLAAHEVDDPWNFGVMDLADDGRIKAFHEKPLIDECSSNLVNTGLYILEPEALEHVPKDKFFDFSKDLFPILLERHSLFGLHTPGFWVDIGRPVGYEQAKKWLMSRITPSISDTTSISGKLEGPIVLGDNVDIGRHCHLIGPIVVGDNVTLQKGCVVGPNTILSNDVNIGSYTLLNGSVIFENTRIGSDSEVASSFIAEDCIIGSNGIIQSDVLIGGRCNIEPNVSIINGSRIWPEMGIQEGSMVSGTLKTFIQVHEVRREPKWILRSLTPDEAFYFNKFEGSHVSFTGKRALSLWEFNKILKSIDESSLQHHMRSEANDFQRWANRVIGDEQLSTTFNALKNKYSLTDIDALRHHLLRSTRNRLNELIAQVNTPGYS